MKTILSVAVLLGLAGAGGYFYLRYYRDEEPPTSVRPVERGNMMPTIGPTGTVEPEQVVDIGSQVNGLVTELKADYGSNVEKNTVLAHDRQDPVPGGGRSGRGRAIRPGGLGR